MGNFTKANLPFVIVHWDDAWKDAVGDTTVQTATDDNHPEECYLGGWLIADDERGVMLVNEYSPNGTYRNKSFVPRGMIKSVTPFNLTKIRKPKAGTE